MLAKQPTIFLRLAKTTLVLVYLVIMAGAVVRATGAGMGCPDWPKCFGKWVPPTDVSQLPADYQEIYKKSYADTTFNVYHTWTEYVNRLLGALLGLAVFALFIAAWYYYRKTDKKTVALCFTGFILVGFQGWLGAKVVASNLAPVKITIHMIVALIILALFIYIINRIKKQPYLGITQALKHIKYVAILCLILSVLQIVLGTQVREEVDVVAKQIDDRRLWVLYLGSLFKLHRSFAWLVLVVNSYMVWQLKKVSKDKQLHQNAHAVIGVLILEVLVGILLAYFSFPRMAQPVHILLACVLFGVQFKLVNRLART